MSTDEIFERLNGMIDAEAQQYADDIQTRWENISDGYAVISRENADLRRQLEQAQAELLHYKTNGVSSIAQGRQIALTATE